MHTLMRDLVHSSDFDSIPFFNHRAVRQFLDDSDKHPESAGVVRDPICYVLASAAVLNRHYNLS